MAPIVLSPHDANTVYAGYQVIYRSRDRGTTWDRISGDLTDDNARQMGINPSAVPYQTLTQIAESPLVKGRGLMGSLGGLFQTHPALDDRIAALETAGGFMLDRSFLAGIPVQ